MKFTFDPQLLEFTGGFEEIEVLPGTLASVLSQVFSRLPQLYVHLVDSEGKKDRLLLVLNDDTLLEAVDTRLVIADSDTIQLIAVPVGEGPAIVMAAEMFFEIALPQIVSTILGVAINMMIQVAVGYAISAIIGALSESIAPPDAAMGVNNSSTYTFDGVKNTSYSGAPIYLVYGKHRVGGNVLSVFTNSNYDNQVSATDLSVQIGICEGEVESISDLYINKSPLSFYNSVSALDVRLGSSYQEVMADFNRVENTTTISRKVTNSSHTFNTALFSTQAYVHEKVYGVVEQNPSDGSFTYSQRKLSVPNRY